MKMANEHDEQYFGVSCTFKLEDLGLLIFQSNIEVTERLGSVLSCKGLLSNRRLDTNQTEWQILDQEKWRQIERQKTVTKKMSSKARQDRNNRQRQAFLYRKNQQQSGYPTLNTEELESTAPTPNDEILELPLITTDIETGTQDTSIDSNPSANQDSADETLINIPTLIEETRKASEEHSAREGAEGQSTKEQEKDTEKKEKEKRNNLKLAVIPEG
ncbi:unnamed protein product [Mytilus coruscus]|uniref:Uncharacterized protein n=1 Tax=Mytilus coruscus TaxID=42192 RepID=A0A6J8EMA8_MYTCO|nr:unnamed protein product [Mytilus coruscus]